jgi:Tfp pilus assembly protein PilF
LSGLVHLQAQRYVDAEQVLSAALARGVEAAEVRYNLAFALFMQQRHADSLEILAAPALSQTIPPALLLRARCLHHLDRREEAVADCRGHLAVVPDSAETQGLLALLTYEQGQSDNARVHAEAALRQHPQQLEAMLVRASMYCDAREYDAARSAFGTLLEAHPECARARLGRGLVELAQMQLDAALQDVERAAAHLPEHIGTWHVLAWIQIMRRDVSAADTAFQQALALNRNFAETHGGLAVIAALQGREVDAEASIKRALRLDPQSLSPRYAQILLLQRQGQHAEAAAVLDVVLASPSGRDGAPYRDLLNAHLKALRANIEPASGPIVRH